MKQFTWLAIGILVTNSLFSQNTGIGTLTPHPSARLEIRDSIRGLLIPRLTTAQRNAIAQPAHSLLIFNIDNFCIEAYDSTLRQWLAVACPATCNPCDSCPLPVIDSLTGPSTACPGDTVVFHLWSSSSGAYVWNMDSSWRVVATGPTGVLIAGQPATVYAYLCNRCGCVGDSMVVQLGSAPSAPSPSVVTPVVCYGDTAVLVVSSGSNAPVWILPSGWVAVGATDQDTLWAVAPSLSGLDTFHVQLCNGCGCSAAAPAVVQVLGGSLNPGPAFQGPSLVCIGDTIVWRALDTAGHTWTWTYPSTWTAIAQGGDSIVLLPDTADGYLQVQVCDSTGCLCSTDSLYITTDSCRPFCKAIGGSTYDHAHAIISLPDGKIVAAGDTWSFGLGAPDIYITALDVFGNLLWTRTIGGSGSDYGRAIALTLDSGFVVAGRTNSYGAGGYDVYVAKFDLNGNVLWTRTVGGTRTDEGLAIAATNDGGCVVAGTTYSFGYGYGDMYVVKLDANGNLQWTRTVGGSGRDKGHAILQSRDGAYVIVGSTTSFGQDSTDVYVVKLDNTGNLVWTRTVGGISADEGYAVTESSDSGYVVAGFTEAYGQGSHDIYVLKLDKNGNLQWTRTIGGSTGHDEGAAIITTQDGGFAVAGSTLSYGQGSWDIYVIKLDANGNVQWTRTIGGTGAELGYALFQDKGRRYLVAGYTTSWGSGSSDVYLIRLDANGNLVSCSGGCQVQTGGVASSGGLSSSGGMISSGGTAGTGGNISSGGTIVNICP